MQLLRSSDLRCRDWRKSKIGNKTELSFVDGPVFGSLIRFALPVLGALILQAAYGAVDLMVVGQFGDACIRHLFPVCSPPAKPARIISTAAVPHLRK